MKNFLVLAPTPTWPADLGGRKGIVTLHESLKRHGKIHFILYAAEGEWRHGFDEAAYEGMRRQWSTFHLIAPTRPVHTHSAGEDHGPDEWWDPAIGDYLSWRFERNSFNALIVHYTWLSKALTFAPRSTHKVLYTADQFSGRREMFESRGFGKEFFHLSREGEAEALGRADTVIAVKEQEEAYFNSLVPGRAITVPHFEPRIDAPAPAPSSVLRVGMIGGYNTINRANFEEFLKIAARVFSTHFAPIEIVVAGGMCDALTHLQHPYVRQLGYVENLEDFYSSVDVVIVPMIWSSGIKIKFAESVAAGRPTLSTAHAAEGYVTHHPTMRCASFGELAMACVKIAFDRRLIPELEAAARRAYAAAEQRLRESVDLLAARISTTSPDVVVFAPRRLQERDCIELEHFWSLVRFLSWRMRPIVVLPADAEIAPRARREIEARFTIVQEDDEAAVEDALSDAIAAAVVEWREPVGRMLSGFRGEVMLFGPATGARVEAPGAKLFVAGLQASEAPLRIAASEVERLDIGGFYRGQVSIGNAWRSQGAHPDHVHLLVGDDYGWLATLLGSRAREWRPHVEVKAIGGELAGGTKTANRPSTAGPRPICAFDLAPWDGRFDLWREIYWSAGVPLVRIAPAGLRRREARPPHCTLECETLGDVVATLNAALRHPSIFAELEPATRRRMETNFAHEAGWGQLWKRLCALVDTRRLLSVTQ